VSKTKQTCVILEGECAGSHVCPLSSIKAGSIVCIKQLSATPELRARLREMGLGERQKVKLVSRQSNIICQVCNARLGISKRLAESILVEALPGQMEAA
jgi:Fe2+ transport system protein FeoA